MLVRRGEKQFLPVAPMELLGASDLQLDSTHYNKMVPIERNGTNADVRLPDPAGFVGRVDVYLAVTSGNNTLNVWTFGGGEMIASKSSNKFNVMRFYSNGVDWVVYSP